MKWIVKLPSGVEYNSLGANPEEAAKFVDHALEAPTLPGQTVELEVRRNAGNIKPTPPWTKVTLTAECYWTAHPLRRSSS